jgi:hypothetical protein
VNKEKKNKEEVFRKLGIWMRRKERVNEQKLLIMCIFLLKYLT